MRNNIDGAVAGSLTTTWDDETRYQWQLPSQRHDDLYAIMIEMYITATVVALGFTALLWFAVIPLMIVAAPSICYVVMSTLWKLVHRQ